MLDINKCIWITGASTGIGKALALKLASEGFNVAVSARSIKNLNNFFSGNFLNILETQFSFFNCINAHAPNLENTFWIFHVLISCTRIL